MSYVEDAIDDLLSRLKGREKAALLGGRQSAVDAITTIFALIERKQKMLNDCREGLMNARENAKVANVDQLLEILDAVKGLVKILNE